MKFNGAVKDICANCGKTEAAELMNCSACRLVKYCSVDCQKTHRHQHKKACKLRAAELEHDRMLFGSGLANKETCPVCFLKIPVDPTQYGTQPCCQQMICSGCWHEMDRRGKDLCPMCRKEKPQSDAELTAMLQERAHSGSAAAMFELGSIYASGVHGLDQDLSRAVDLWTRAAHLGSAKAQHNLGVFHEDNDPAKARSFYECAAMGGFCDARYILARIECNEKKNPSAALKHVMISAKMGHAPSLAIVESMFKQEIATKDEYEEAWIGFKSALDEMESPSRAKARQYFAENPEVEEYRMGGISKKEAKEIIDAKLFGLGTERPECPACLVALPGNRREISMAACCGTVLCIGCGFSEDFQGIRCPFCGHDGPIHEEDYVAHKKKRSDEGNSLSKFQLGIVHMDGKFEIPQNTDVALQLWNEAADLGLVEAKFRLGVFYEEEDDDVDRAVVLYEEAAMEGHSEYRVGSLHFPLADNILDTILTVVARYKLGCIEVNYGCSSRAVRHFAVGAKMGNDDCLNALEGMAAEGDATTKEYEDALAGYQSATEKAKTPSREKAKDMMASNEG